MSKRKLGIAIVGLGGAVGTTVFRIELLKKGVIEKQGLPLAEIDVAGLADYEDIFIAGWISLLTSRQRSRRA